MGYDVEGATTILKRTPRGRPRITRETPPMGTVDAVKTLVAALDEAARLAGCQVDGSTSGVLSITSGDGSIGLVEFRTAGEPPDLRVVIWNDCRERPDIEWSGDEGRFVGPWIEDADGRRHRRDALHELAELVSQAMLGETTRS